MGIAVGLFVPNKEDGTPQAPGVNPFQVRVDRSKACRWAACGRAGERACVRAATRRTATTRERQLRGRAGRVEREAGVPTSEVGVVNFQYQPGDLSMVSMTGVPTVKLGSTLRFTNLEAAVDLPHRHVVRLPLPRPDRERHSRSRTGGRSGRRGRLRLVRDGRRRPRSSRPSRRSTTSSR